MPIISQNRLRTALGLLIACIVMSWQSWPSPRLIHAQSPQLSVGATVSGTLAADETQRWTFTPTEDVTVMIFANRTFGDLDPVLSIYGEDDTLIAENDDRVPGVVFDAGVTLDAEADTIYNLEVTPFSGAGLYELVVLPGFAQLWADETFTADFSRWSTPYTTQAREALVLNNRQLANRPVTVTAQGEVPLGDAAVHAQLRWSAGASGQFVGAGLRLQATDTLTPDGYYFTLSPDGRWQVGKREFGTLEELDSGQTSAFNATAPVMLTASVEGERLQLYANGTRLANMTDSAFSAGHWGLHLLAANAESVVTIERVFVTTPAIPLPEMPATIDSWRSARPDDIANELAAAGAIPEGGRRTYTVLDTAYEVSPSTTITYPQAEAGVIFTEMLLNVDVRLTDGVNMACGVSFHELGEQNLSLAYVDVDGGAGLLYTRDGQLEWHSYNLLDAPPESLSNGRQRLTVIAYGPYTTLYVNGRYFVTHFSPVREGALGVGLINYATNSARCAFSNLWVWQ